MGFLVIRYQTVKTNTLKVNVFDCLYNYWIPDYIKVCIKSDDSIRQKGHHHRKNNGKCPKSQTEQRASPKRREKAGEGFSQK